MESKKDYTVNIELFKGLIESTMEPEFLKRELTQLYFNYTRQVINYHETGAGVCPRGDIDDQLYCLIQIIAVCDTERKFPLGADVFTGDKEVVQVPGLAH